MKLMFLFIVGLANTIMGLGDWILCQLLSAFDLSRPTGLRLATRDVQSYTAFKYRMPAGFPGDVNRTHPASILPCLIDDDTPPLRFGGAVIADGADNSVRQPAPGDIAAKVYGFLCRPFPYQQTVGGMSADFGVGTPPASGVCDILRAGYIMTQISGGGTPRKGDPVYIWVAASTGNHIQGYPETAPTTGSTVLAANCTWNGPGDGNNVAEISVVL